MAEFCEQCAQELGFECGDFFDMCERGMKIAVLCEDCGPIYVDHNGFCVSDCGKNHFKAGMPWSGSMEKKISWSTGIM